MNELIKNNDKTYSISSLHNNFHIGIAARSAIDIDYTKELSQVRSEEKKLLASLTGIDRDRIIFLSQVHEDRILDIDAPMPGDSLFAGEADGMITTEPETCLVIRTADCVPVFATDEKRNVLGAAHSGWRGTQKEISRKLVRKMKNRYGSSYNDIAIYILPSIGEESYIVNEDVAQYFPDNITRKNGTIHLSLWSHIEQSLLEEGIKAEAIHNSSTCNYIANDEFFSHRRGDPGRNLNFAFFNRI